MALDHRRILAIVALVCAAVSPFVSFPLVVVAVVLLAVAHLL